MADRYDGKLDPARCVARVREKGKWTRYFQCRSKPQKGAEWCGTHAPSVETGEFLWAVADSFQETSLTQAAIVKETAKTITLKNSGRAFDYKSRIPKTAEGEPSIGARTREGALRRYLQSCEGELAQARRVAATKAAKVTAAKELLAEELGD